MSLGSNNKVASWKVSLLVGAGAVIASLVMIGVWYIPIESKSRIILSTLIIIFLVFALLHQTIANWEQIAKRRTIRTLCAFGGILIVKGIVAQGLRIASTNIELSVQSSEKELFTGRLVVALTSTPEWIDLAFIVIGFLMLLSVLFFTSKTKFTKNRNENIIVRDEEKNHSVNVNVTQVFNSDIAKNGKKEKLPKYRLTETYDSDLPPFIDIWVGREPELTLLNEIKAGVIVVTGIGGQGKSTLAAKALELCRESSDSDYFWIWRDCKEQADSFRTQLLSVLEYYTQGAVTADKVDDANIYKRRSKIVPPGGAKMYHLISI